MDKPLRVLIVEDSEDDAQLLLRQLQRGGYDPRHERVETPRAMRAALGRQTWDVVLSDYSMPQFSGPAALELLQETGLDLPFIIVSGQIGEETAVEAMRAGAHDYLLKDRLARLAAAVERELHEADVRQERRLMEERIEHLNAVLRTIRNIDQLIVRGKDGDRLLQRVCEILLETRGYYSAWGVLWDEERGLVTSAEAGLGEDFLPMLKKLRRAELPDCAREALKQPGPALTADPLITCSDCPLARKYPGRGGITIRLEQGGKVYGFLVVSTSVDFALNKEEQTLLQDMAGDIAFALHDMELEEKHQQAELEHVRVQRLQAVGELSAGISHNLNNILTSVLGPAQLLQRKTEDPVLLEGLQEIIAAGQHAVELVHRLHQSARGGREDVLQPVDLNRAVEEAVRDTRPRWKDESQSKGIVIEVVTAPGEVPLMRGSESKVHDILVNLLLNAVDALPDGGTITIETTAGEEGIQLEFSDTGTGMDEETRRRVFEPFFTTRPETGTGLGLSTVYATIEGWGGSIEVDSTPGEGTTFRLRFPVWTEEEVEEGRKTTVESTRSGKILVVDDDEAICSLLSLLLEEQHEVETATDSQKALERFTPGKYDVAMIDLGMSGLSGDRLVRQIREIDPGVVTVLITGWDLPETDTRVSSFDFQMVKPFDDLDKVEDVVARAIAVRDRRTEEGS